MPIKINGLNVKRDVMPMKSIDSVVPYTICLGFTTELHVEMQIGEAKELEETIFKNPVLFTTLQNMEIDKFNQEIKNLQEQIAHLEKINKTQHDHLARFQQVYKSIFGNYDDPDEDEAWSDL